ncbi:hypothetical protein VTH06DRAFT_470 [Thermothelomyces fergusii]
MNPFLSSPHTSRHHTQSRRSPTWWPRSRLGIVTTSAARLQLDSKPVQLSTPSQEMGRTIPRWFPSHAQPPEESKGCDMALRRKGAGAQQARLCMRRNLTMLFCQLDLNKSTRPRAFPVLG